jgi:diguanylate cyclase
MFKDIVAQIAIIIAILFFSNEVFKRGRINGTVIPLIMKIKIGLVEGCYGIIIMFFGVRVPPNCLFDLRQVFVIIAAYLGGLYASILTAIVISVGRVLLFGGINGPSIKASISLLIAGVVAGFIFDYQRPKGYWVKWIISLLVAMGTILVSTLSLLSIADASRVLIYILPLVFFGGLFVAYLVRYLVRSSELFLQREQEATTDFLTQLNNVRSFDRIFNEIAKEASIKNENLSLLLIDIDYFKKVNDQYGHLAGDAVLKEIAVLLKGAAMSTDIVSRNGGEEFSVLLPGKSKTESVAMAERIRSIVEKHLFDLKELGEIQLTVSIGVANFPEIPLDSLIDSADQALYESKHTGRNRVYSYTRSR